MDLSFSEETEEEEKQQDTTITNPAPTVNETPKIEDPRLQEIMSEGIDGDFVLVGFPHDEGVVLNGGRRGWELGPDCLRRFLPKVGPLYNWERQISIANLRLTDYGNIQLEEDSWQAGLEKLRTKIVTILEKPQKPRVIVVGGGDDLSYPTALATMQATMEAAADDNIMLKGPEDHIPRQETAILRIDPQLDVKSEDFHSGSHFRKLLEEGRFVFSNARVTHFGAQGTEVGQSYYEYLEGKKCEIMWLRQIQHSEVPGDTAGMLREKYGIHTKAAGWLYTTLQNLSTDNYTIYVSFDLSAIIASSCPGVSFPSAAGGFHSEEVIEMGLVFGLFPSVRVISFSEYSPTVEDARSGLLLANTIYHILLGEVMRKL